MKTTMYSVLGPLSLSDFFATPRTVASQAPLSLGLPRQEYWSGLPFPPPPEDLPDPEIKPASPALHVDSSPLIHLGRPITCHSYCQLRYKDAEKQRS